MTTHKVIDEFIEYYEPYAEKYKHYKDLIKILHYANRLHNYRVELEGDKILCEDYNHPDCEECFGLEHCAIMERFSKKELEFIEYE